MHLGKFIPACPEQLGGLSTPRPPAEIVVGSGEDVLNGKTKVITISGEDITMQFIKGAEETLKITNAFPIKAAILKERSPSCGVHQIYDGSFNNILKKGQGLTTAILKKENIPVYSEEELTKELLEELLKL